MPSHEEIAHALIDIAIDTSLLPPARPIAEVIRPALQHAVQPAEHLGPGSGIGGNQVTADFGLKALYALLGWTGA